jgi:hypothetical protein
MGKKPRGWSPDGLKYLMIINPFGWRNPRDGNSRDVAPGHLVAWLNHALGHREGDSVVQELAWRAKVRPYVCGESRGDCLYPHRPGPERQSWSVSTNLWVLRVFWESTDGRNSVST